MLFKNLVIDPNVYQLWFQESEPVYLYEEGVVRRRPNPRTRHQHRLPDLDRPRHRIGCHQPRRANPRSPPGRQGQARCRVPGTCRHAEPASPDLLTAHRTRRHRPLVRRCHGPGQGQCQATVDTAGHDEGGGLRSRKPTTRGRTVLRRAVLPRKGRSDAISSRVDWW